MILSLEIWVLPAIAAGASSYLVSLGWERFRRATAPTGPIAGFLASLSCMMGGVCSYYRHITSAPSLEGNIIVMFVAGASSTYLWLLLRRYLPAFKSQSKG